MKIIYTKGSDILDLEGNVIIEAGSVSVVIPARQQDVVKSLALPNPELSQEIAEMTELQFMEWLTTNGRDVPPDAVDVKIVEDDAVPTDRTFRNAWQNIDGEVSVEMGRARELKKEMLRIERKPLLEQLDIDFMRAIESGDEAGKNRITIEKQRLRDITELPAIAMAETAEALKAITI